MTMPDSAPPDAPPKAIKTSTDPCVFAREDGLVASTMSAVPLIKPKFQPSPSRARAIASTSIESAGATVARIPAASRVIPEAIVIIVHPNLSTRIPVTRDGRYIAPIWMPIISPMSLKPCPWSFICTGVIVIIATMTIWVEFASERLLSSVLCTSAIAFANRPGARPIRGLLRGRGHPWPQLLCFPSVFNNLNDDHKTIVFM